MFQIITANKTHNARNRTSVQRIALILFFYYIICSAFLLKSIKKRRNASNARERMHGGTTPSCRKSSPRTRT